MTSALLRCARLGSVLTWVSLLLSFAVTAELMASQTPATQRARLPPLALEDLPDSVRIDLQRALAAADARPGDVQSVGRLAELLHAYEQHGLAAAYYEVAAGLDPHAFRWTYLLGVVQAELGNHEAAAGSFRRARAIDPAYLAASLRFAEASLKSGDVSGSRVEYARLLRRFPEMALAHYGLGRAEAAQGELQAAIEHYRRATELAPQFGRAHYVLALAYRDAGSIADAQSHLDAYRKHGSRRPGVPDPVLEEVRAMAGTAREIIAQAVRLGSAGKLHESIAMHTQALAADPLASRAHVNLIALYGRTGQVALAEQHYRAALKLGTDLADAHYNYGVLQAAAGQEREAADAFRAALEADPFNAQAHNNLGALLARLKRHGEAAEHYRQALASDPQHPNARFGLGGALLALGRPREAVEHFEQLLATESADTPRHTYALAAAWMAAGDPERARKYAAEALDLARRLGQSALAARIEAELPKMRKPQ